MYPDRLGWLRVHDLTVIFGNVVGRRFYGMMHENAASPAESYWSVILDPLGIFLLPFAHVKVSRMITSICGNVHPDTPIPSRHIKLHIA